MPKQINNRIKPAKYKLTPVAYILFTIIILAFTWYFGLGVKLVLSIMTLSGILWLLALNQTIIKLIFMGCVILLCYDIATTIYSIIISLFQ
ncbi:MAG: hypothetical protein H6Q74_2553 [Firmicutes bacterium]|nr:hypothetical protein [Bacillota bacterium]